MLGNYKSVKSFQNLISSGPEACVAIIDRDPTGRPRAHCLTESVLLNKDQFGISFDLTEFIKLSVHP